MADSLQSQIKRARRPVAGAAALRLRRLARAAHAADDHPAGRRRALRPARGLPAGHRAHGRAAAHPDAALRAAARRPARDQPVRRRFGAARDRTAQPRAPRRGLDRRDGARSPSRRARTSGSSPPAATPTPRSTRVASAASCATCSATPSSTARAGPIVVTVDSNEQAVALSVRDYGLGMSEARRAARVRPVLARRPVPQAHHRRHRARAWPSRSRTPQLHGGTLELWSKAGRRHLLPAHPAPRPRRAVHPLAAPAAAGGRRRRTARDTGCRPPRRRSGV